MADRMLREITCAEWWALPFDRCCVKREDTGIIRYFEIADPRTEFAGRLRHVQVDQYPPLQVTPDELAGQHAAGWPDFHPETYCHRCGNQNVSWFTAPETWNPVMRPYGDGTRWRWSEIICIPCFIEMAERLHGPRAWRLSRDEYGSETLELLPASDAQPAQIDALRGQGRENLAGTARHSYPSDSGPETDV